MRNAALTLGLIGGLWGMLVGFFSFGYTDLLIRYPELAEYTGGVANMGLIRAMSLLAPVLAIAGGAMARSANLAAGVLLLISATGMYFTFGFGVFTMFPIAMCGLAGVLALAARQPDPH
ncbi:hypothetical protein [Roseinatronobacter monicus]|uniref:Major facilitator superfamily (MFS) profile domain-containing protein n=1 Tax=Roseinatronobacter monicus TaxID=393481 RepID=A0A543KEI3_9RHOB|nr:hypothetical protein [Roseinatronobacter monicus]TQM93481.1 hypothetical protein BD293_2117 [Roseinatronobacter monicus]